MNFQTSEANTTETNRVDVTETFSADQRWFRNNSGLFKRCSFSENLWTELETKNFRAKNQRWAPLISSETVLIWRIQNGNFWFNCNFSKKFFWSNSIFEAHNFGLQPKLRKEVNKKTYLFNLLTGQKYNKNLSCWDFRYCSSIKTDVVQFLQRIFLFTGINELSRIIWKKLCFCCHLQNFCEIYFFFNTGIQFYWPLRAFLSLLTALSYFDILFYLCIYQSWFKINQRWVSTENPMFQS